MADFESTSVETTEVAEPSEETGVEDQVVAEPESEENNVEPEETTDGKTEKDAAWARMRREKEEAQSELEAARAELAEIKASNEARDAAFSRLTGKEQDGEIVALAELTGLSEDEIRAEIDAANESAQKDLRIEALENMVANIEADRLMQADLERLRKIDPSLKSIEDLGEEYGRYISAADPVTGEPLMTPEDAYWAIKAKEQATKATPPKEVGRVATGTAEKDYFTDAEIDAMTPEQLAKNHKKILASWERNNKR